MTNKNYREQKFICWQYDITSNADFAILIDRWIGPYGETKIVLGAAYAASALKIAMEQERTEIPFYLVEQMLDKTLGTTPLFP